MNIHHTLMETFGKYSGAPIELRDLTREFTTFWLSQASLQKAWRCYLCAKSLNRYVINWQAGAKLIRHVRQYNGFPTLNASAIKQTS